MGSFLAFKMSEMTCKLLVKRLAMRSAEWG